MRELSKEEKAFIRDKIASNEKVVEHTKKTPRKGVYWLFRPSFWASVSFVTPFILTGVFIYIIYRVQSFFGGEATMKWLIKHHMDSSVQLILSKEGLGWLTNFIQFYEHRAIIIALIFTVFFIISAMLLILDVFITKKKENNEDE